MANPDSNLVLSISTDLTTIRNQLKKFGDMVDQAGARANSSFTRAGKSMDAAFSNTSAVQTRINKMMGIATSGTKEWTGALADQGAQLEALKRKYSPLYAAQQKYLASLKDIQQANAIGAITDKEAAAAIARTKAGFAGSVIAINGTRRAIDETTKSFKLNRIGMMELQAAGINSFQALAAGMSPFQVATMEGAQVVGAFVQGSETGFSGVVSKIGGAAAKMADMVGGPLPAIAIGLAAAGAAGVAAFGDVEVKTVSSSDALKEFNALVKEAADNSKEWAASLKDAGKLPASIDSLLAHFKQVTDDTGFSLNGQITAFQKAASQFQSAAANMMELANPTEAFQSGFSTSGVFASIDAAQQKIGELAGGLQDGSLKAQDVLDQLNQLSAANTYPTSLDDTLRKLEDIAKQAAEDQRRLAALSRQSRIAGPAMLEDMTNNAGQIGQLQTRTGNAWKSKLIEGLNKQSAEKNPGPYGDFNVPTPGERPNPESFAPPGHHGGGGGGSHKALNAFQSGMRSTDAQLKQLQARAAVLKSVNPLFDDYGAAMAEATKKQQLLSDAEKAGITLSPAQVAAINQEAAAYGKQTAAVNQATAANDRMKQNMQELRNLGKDVLGGFIQDLEHGKSAAQALGDALQKVADKLLNSALDGLFGGGSGRRRRHL